MDMTFWEILFKAVYYLARYFSIFTIFEISLRILVFCVNFQQLWICSQSISPLQTFLLYHSLYLHLQKPNYKMQSHLILPTKLKYSILFIFTPFSFLLSIVLSSKFIKPFTLCVILSYSILEFFLFPIIYMSLLKFPISSCTFSTLFTTSFSIFITVNLPLITATSGQSPSLLLLTVCSLDQIFCSFAGLIISCYMLDIFHKRTVGMKIPLLFCQAHRVGSWVNLICSWSGDEFCCWFSLTLPLASNIFNEKGFLSAGIGIWALVRS